MTEEPKAKSKSVSLPPALWEQVENKATESHGANRSAYIRDLVEQDLIGQITHDDSNCLLNLAAIYHPTLKAKLSQLFGQQTFLSQPRVVARFLDALVRAMDADDFNPEAEFILADKARMTAWENMDAGNLRLLATQIAGILEKKEPEPLLQAAAEAAAPYIAEEQKAKSDAKLAQEAIRSVNTKPSKRSSKAS